jgi:hypothetical protein
MEGGAMIDEKLYEKLPSNLHKGIIKKKVVNVGGKLGKKYARSIMELDPEFKQSMTLEGGSFLHDFLTGFTSVLDLGKMAFDHIPGPEAELASKMTAIVNTGATILDEVTKPKKKKRVLLSRR